MVQKTKQYWQVFAAALLGVSAYLQFSKITTWSFWFDESFTSFLVKYDYWDVVTRTARDVHPPLYYLLLKVWKTVFGESDFALRSLSAVFMLAASWLVFKLSYKLTKNKPASLTMVALAALGPFVIRYGQEARMYGLAAMLTTAASLLMVSIMQAKKVDRRMWQYASYAFLVAACLYTHYFTFPLIVAHWLYVVLADTDFSPNLKQNPLKQIKSLFSKLDNNWTFSNLVALALFAPWLPTFVAQSSRVSSGFWIGPVDYKTIPSTFIELLTFKGLSNHDLLNEKLMIAIVAVLFLGLSWLFYKVNRKEKANLVLLLGPVFASAIILYSYSSIPGVSSIYYIRYFASLSVLFYAGQGYVLYLVYVNYSKIIAIILAVGLSAVMLSGVQTVLNGEGKNFFSSKQGIAVLNEQLQSGDLVVAQAYWQAYDALHYIKSDFTPRVQIEGNFYGGDTLLIGRDEIVYNNYSELSTDSGVIWFISESKDMFADFPDDWELRETIFNEGDFRVTRFVVN